MSDLGERLERLELYQYLEVLVAEGFDTWETVLDITESDLNSLNVKLGHRRKLQRAIAESRGQSSDRPLFIKNTRVNGSYRSYDLTQESKTRLSEQPLLSAADTSTKRKYRRHPTPDEYAPKRPPSAYVIFSNQMREALKGQELSFTEIAKVVGERWRDLPMDAREACECQANAAKEKYYAELAEYKKSSQYDTYQKYLKDFKAKHGVLPKAVDGKRSMPEIETSTSTSETWGRNNEQVDRLQDRRINSAQSNASAIGHQSPPIVPVRLLSGPLYPSNSAFRTVQSPSISDSPQISDRYSPSPVMSPRSTTLHKGNSHKLHANAILCDARRHTDANMHYPPSAYGHLLRHTVSTTLPAAFRLHCQDPIDLLSPRSFREPAQLTSSSPEDMTLSSDIGDSGYNTTIYLESLLPVIDARGSNRMLPQPVSSLDATLSPLDRHRLPAPSPQIHAEFCTNSSFAALLRAGELARAANDEESGKEGCR